VIRHILIVEDSESDARLLERALRSAGVVNPIDWVENGADAIAYLLFKERNSEKDAPDQLGVIFLDLKLPDRSGFELLKLLRGRTAFKSTLRVMVSSIEDMENIRRAYTLGADSFIAKPVGQLDLKELIRSFPDHWSLVDIPLHEEAQQSASDTRLQAAHAWSQHRELVNKVRETLRTLKEQINDNEETMTIIETLAEEMRNELDPSTRARPKTKPWSLL